MKQAALFAEEVSDGQRLVDNFLIEHANFVHNEMIEHQQVLIDLIGERSEITLEQLEQHVNGLLNHFQKLQHLRQAQPQLFSILNRQLLSHQQSEQTDITQCWSEQLAEQVTQLEALLKASIVAEAQEDEADDDMTTLNRWVKICKLLSRVDTVLGEAVLPNYGDLYKRYQQVLLSKSVPALRELFSALNDKNYNQVVALMSEHFSARLTFV